MALRIQFAIILILTSGYPVFAAPGDLLWTYETGDIIYSSPAVDDAGNIYFGCEDGNVYCLTPEGAQKWAYPVGDWVDSTPAISPQGILYVGAWDNFFYALNTDDGSLIWKYETDSLIVSSPALDTNGNIYFGSSDGFFYSLAPDGTLRWEQVFLDELDSSPAINQAGIYFGCADGSFHALNLDGTIKWTFAVQTTNPLVDPRIISSPAIGGDGALYFGAGDGYLYCLNPDGSLRWRYAAEGTVDTSPAIDIDGTIYIADRKGWMHAINPLTGTDYWKREIGDVFYCSPAVGSNNSIYIASFIGNYTSRIYSINTVSGENLWTYDVNHLVDSSPLLTSDGMLLIGSHDKTLYAFDAVNGPALSPWPQFGQNPQRTGNPLEIKISEDPPPPPTPYEVAKAFFPGSEDRENEWIWIDWLGALEVSSFPLAWHNMHGWLTFAGDGGENIWFWDGYLGWLFTTPQWYPFLYSSREISWHWYAPDTTNPRWIYNYSSNEWEYIDRNE